MERHEAKTICVNCEHVRQWLLATTSAFACGHEANRLPQKQNPVSGYWCPAQPFPACEDINDGNCPHYEPVPPAPEPDKRSWWQRLFSGRTLSKGPQ